MDGFVAQVDERGRKGLFAEKLEKGVFGGLQTGGGEGDGAVVKKDGLAVDGAMAGVEALGAGGGFLTAGGATDGEEVGNTEFGFDVEGEGVEVAVGAEKAGQPEAGGVVGASEIGRKRAVRGGTGEEPFEGDAGIEGEELAEAFGKAAVALEGGVVDGNSVVGDVFFQAALAGGTLLFSIGQCVVLEGIVERGREVGKAGAEAQADEKGAGP